MRTILHLDMDAFFAAVELRRHPELRGLPVVIGGHGDPRERGVVATASYEARRFGIHSAMPLRTAYGRCPQAVFLPVDIDFYVAVSAQIMTLIKAFSLPVEEAGLDEVFIDLSDSPRPAEAVALAIKQRISEELHLPCSIGIGPNRLLAKLATDLGKPDGLTRLSNEDLASRIWPLPARMLWGVGPKTEARLAALGIRTIGDLTHQPEEGLAQEFGPKHGHSLHDAAWGIDESPLVTSWQAKSMGREVTFQHDIHSRTLLHAMVAHLSHQVTERLHAEGFQARGVTVTMRFSNFETHTRGCTLPRPEDDPEILAHAAAQCLDRLPLVRPVRLVGMRADRLEPVRHATGGP